MKDEVYRLEDENLVEENYDLLLDDLFRFQLISEPTMYFCMSNGLFSLLIITDFYENNDNFLSFSNCSETINSELTAVCERFKPKNLYPFDFNYDLPLINSLTPLQFEVVEAFLNYNLIVLETKNPSLHKFLTETSQPDFSFEFIIKILFSDNFDLLNRDYIRREKITYYFKFKTALENFIVTISNSQETEILKKKFSRCAKLSFVEIFDISEYTINFDYDQSGKIKLFAYLNHLIIQPTTGLSYRDTLIFQNIYTNTFPDSPNLKLLAEKYFLTYERLRLIIGRIKLKTSYILEKIEHLNPMVFSDYENSDTKFIISIDDEIVQHINAIENVSFNQSFYILIYSHLYSKKFYVFENKKVIIHDKYYQVKRKIEGFYMIHKDLCKRFNFEEFVSDFAYNKSNRYVAVFNIVEYIANKLSLENKRFQNEIYLVCKVLLAAEYDVKPDEQGNINFSKTILIKYPEICYNLLKKEAKPLHVNYMYEILQQSDTLRNIRKDAIRLAMIKNKDIFMYIGRSSIWGLNEWEKENPNYKGGSIRTIAFEFLQQRSSPTRRSELIEYILKYRPNSNHKSITQNLKIDIQKRFLFFENFYVGLAQKEYPEKPKLANTLIKDWESRVIETKEFIQTLKRFPKVNSKDKSEKSLASFFFRLRFLSRIGTLSKEKEDFLKSINFPLERKKIEPGLID